MAKKKNQKLSVEEPAQEQAVQTSGIQSFLKDAIEKTGHEYTPEKADKILTKFNHDYDKVVDFAAGNVGIKDKEKFKTAIYDKYKLVKPSDEQLAEIDFLKKPISVDPEKGYERYQQLQEEKTLAQSMAERLKPAEEELPLMPDLKQPSDVTRVVTPGIIDEERFLTPQQKQAKAESEANQERITSLQSKIDEIEAVSAEQAKLNIKKFGYASKEHEAVGKEYENYSSLIQNAVADIEESGAKHGYGFGFGAGTSAYTPDEAEKVRKVKNLKNIKELYGKMGKILGAPQGENFNAQMSGLLHGFSDNFFTKDFATLGLNEMGRLLNVKDAFDTQKEIEQRITEYGTREDGSAKGGGWLGEITLSNGDVATEYSIGVNLGGREVQIPTLVPTLTEEEIELMKNDIIPNNKDVPDGIANKAIAFAIDRLEEEESPFITNEEYVANNIPEEQKALLDAYQQLLQIQAGSKGNFGSTIGEGLKEMIPFIAQFAATGGIGAGAKKLVKEFVEAKTKKAIAGKIAGVVAKPLVQAAAMVPAELQNYAQRVAPTMDAEGNLIEGQEPINAAFKAYLTTVAEVAGEDVGVFTNKWANKAARKNFTKLIANNPNKAQEFLGKLSLALTRETNMPGIQGFVFEGIGEEATGIMQAAIDQDGSFFTPEAQAQVWAMSLLASGSFAALSIPNRVKTRLDFKTATDLLNDIPNAEYAKAAEDITKNYTDPEESLEALDAISGEFEISEEDYNKARNFIGNSVKYNQMNTVRALEVEQRIAQSKGNDGNVTLTQYNGELYSVRNPEDLGKEGKVIYLKNQDGTKVTPVISSKITDYESKSPDQIVEEQVNQQDQLDEAFEQEQKIQEEAAQRGLVEGNTVETPQGKRTLVSVNPDGTATVKDNKGEQSVANTSEIEPYKTQEQKDTEKAEEEAVEQTLMEGIDEGAEMVSDEPLTEDSDVRVVDFSNGQSKIITPEGEQVFDTPQERDTAIKELVTGEIEAVEETIDDMPPEQAFAEMRKDDPEIATEIFTDEINGIRAQAEDSRKQAKETASRKQKQELLLEAKRLDNEAERLDAILQDPSVLDEVIEEEIVEEVPELSVEDAAEQLNQEYLTEVEQTPFNRLTPWQQDLVGMKVGRDQFIDAVGKDVARENKDIIQRWFVSRKNENPTNKIDNIAADLSITHNREVTPQDVVDFILENPTNSVRRTTDRMNEIAAEYKDLTGQTIKKHVAEPVAVAEDVEGFEVEKEIPFRTEGVNVTEKAQEDIKNRQNAIKELNKLQDKFGIPIEVINSEELSPEAKAKAREVGSPKAFYQNGTAYILSDQITSVSDVKKSYLHEALLHKGLDVIFEAGPVTLLGKSYETKNDLLNDVFNRMDKESIDSRAKVYYPGVALDQLTEVQQRELAEEALATLNETESPRLQVMLDKLHKFIKKLLGFSSQQFSKTDLRNLLREHRDLIIKQKKDAESLRKDERKVPETRDVREEVAAEGREDLQQQAEARTEARDEEQVRFRTREEMSELKDQNKATWPKIRTNNLFKNDMDNIPHSESKPYNDLIESEQGIVQEVSIDEIIPTQRNLNANNIEEVEQVDLKPELSLYDGKYYVVDGHHRIANAILDGEKSIDAVVYDPAQADIRFRVAESQKELDDFVKDSKVKETVYHGTDAKFTEFVKNFAPGFGTGIYFTDNKDMTEEFGKNIMSVKLDIKKPATDQLGSYTKEIETTDVWKQLEDKRWNEALEEGEYEADERGDFYLDYNEEVEKDVNLFNNALRELGYDAIIAEGSNNIEGREIVVFEPDQVLIEPKEDVKFRVEDLEKLPTVYHGSDIAIDEFEIGRGSGKASRNKAGIFFTTDPKFAQSWGENINERKLQLSNPVTIDSTDPIIKEIFGEEGFSGNIKAITKKKADKLKEAGFDGVVGWERWTDWKTGVRNKSDVYMTFDTEGIIKPTEVKIEAEREKVDTDPSDKAKSAGNYKKGHVKFDGFDVSIENPKGSIRKGVDEQGNKWSAIMPSDYGYFKRTEGADGDQVDVHLGPNLESDKVYVVDQVNPETREFDEVKVMMGYNSLSEARNAYNEAYEEGWTGLGSITRTTKDGLKEWFKGDTKKPFAPETEVKFRANDDHWLWILGGASSAEMYTGKEKQKKLSNNIKRFTSELGSVRYVKYINNEPVAGIQIMTRGDFASVANIYTLPDERRKGYGKELAMQAKSDYPTIKHSDVLEPDGVKFSEAVKFRVTSQDPEVQKMLDKLQAIQALSKTAARVKGLEAEARQTLPLERQTILSKIEGIKEGAKLGAKDTKEMIKEVQKLITDYAKKSIPLGEAGARDIGSMLTLVKESQTPESIEKAFERIDELTGQNVDKIERRKHVSKVNRLLKWMTGLKKSGTKKVGKFNYTDSKQFQELKDINKQTIDLVKKTNSYKASAIEKSEASAKLEQMWNDLNEKPIKTTLDDAMMKLIELRRLGSKASPKLAQIVSEELEAIYLTAKEAKSQVDMIKGMERRESKDMVKSFLETNKSLKNLPWFKRAMTQINTGVADIMGNWETLMTMIGGTELRDKMSFMLNEANITVGKQETNDALLNAAKDIYNVDSKTGTLNKIHDLSKTEYELRQPNRKGKEGAGDPMELSKLHLMDIYNALKNEDVANDYYMTYGDITLDEDGSRDTEAQKADGKATIDKLIENLSEEDEAFADTMQEELDKYYDRLNEIHIKLYNRDLPRVENYWPSTAEREQDIDVMEQFFVESRHPSATKERMAHRTPMPQDAFNKFTKHVDEAEWYANMSMPVMEANRLFKDNNIKALITDMRGKNFYKNIEESLQNVTLMPPGKMQQKSKLTSLLNPLLNNWVASKIGATPSVPLKQLLSAVNYAENMPMEQWAAGFVKNMVNPKDTWSEMMKIPYLKARLGDGYSEAVQRALNGDENVHKAKAHNYHTAFKNLMTIGTRYGDITAIIFGGKPYLDYLLKQDGMTEKEAVDKFLQDTLRSQQAPFASTLSKLQNSKNPFFRAIFAFSNTPSQYMRKLFEANQNLRVQKKQLDAGKISQEDYNKARKQTIKAHTIYGLVNTVTFTMAGSLINAMMKGSDADDEIWKDMLNQLGQTYIGGLPVIKDLLGGFTRKSLGMPVYDDSKPFVEGLDEVVSEGIKLSRGESKDLAKSYERVAQGVATMLAVPYYNIKKDIKAIPPFREETFETTRTKEAERKLNKLKKGDDKQVSDAANNLKKAYSSAKRKAKKLKGEGKYSSSDRITKLINKSKVNIWESDYSAGDMKMEMEMFIKMVDRIK